MKRNRRCVLATAALAGLMACQGGDRTPATGEPAGSGEVPDRPAPAFSDPASPAPIGTDVGTASRDTSGGRVANDSVAVPGR